MEFEDILKQVGDYGKYQKRLTIIFLIPVSLIVPWFWLNLIFMLSVPEHWCNVSELVSSNLSIAQQRAIISPISDPSCSTYRINYTSFLSDEHSVKLNETEIISCPNGWQYDKENYESTAPTQWDMVCKYNYYPSLVFTLTNVGSLIGTPLYGYIADKFGRKICFLLMAGVVSATEIASVLVNDFAVFAVLRALNGSAFPSLFVVSYVLILEIVAPKMRTHMYGIIHISWTLGLCVLALVAYLSRTWKMLGIITSLAGFFILLYWRYLPETPCWLLSQGKCEETATILMEIGKQNGKRQNKEHLLQQLTTLSEKIRKQKETESQETGLQILKYRRLLKTFLILCFCWTASNVAYNGLFYNIRNLSGNDFLNFFLLSVVEFPGNMTFWYLIGKIGRRWTATFGYLAVGLVSLIPLIDFPSSDIVSSMLGKFFITGSYMVTDQQGSELFPTVKRSSGLSMAKTVAAAVTLLVPYIADLGTYGKAIPFVIISLTCLGASALTSFLPETLNRNLPQTFSDAEEFGQDQKFFSLNRITPTENPETIQKY